MPITEVKQTSATAKAGTDKISSGIVMVGAVFTVAVLAGINKGLGKVLLIIMLGFLLLWAMAAGSHLLPQWISQIGTPQKSNAIHTVG